MDCAGTFPHLPWTGDARLFSGRCLGIGGVRCSMLTFRWTRSFPMAGHLILVGYAAFGIIWRAGGRVDDLSR